MDVLQSSCEGMRGNTCLHSLQGMHAPSHIHVHISPCGTNLAWDFTDTSRVFFMQPNMDEAYLATRRSLESKPAQLSLPPVAAPPQPELVSRSGDDLDFPAPTGGAADLDTPG